MQTDKALRAGFSKAQEITRKYAKTFYFASRFLSKEKRYASYAVYAFCRLSDESVDSFTPNTQTPREINRLKACLESVYSDLRLDDSLLLALRKTIREYDIPKQYFDALIEGMCMDLGRIRYEDFDALYEYCYRAAGVVGLMMLKILGCNSKKAEEHAVNLGIAMQLTNILRDIKEDLARRRVYIPQDELRRFGLTETDISKGRNDDNFKALMKFELQRARGYYKDSQTGFRMLTGARSRFVALAMKEMYAGILKAIEKNDYDIYSRRARLNALGKAAAALKVLIGFKYL